MKLLLTLTFALLFFHCSAQPFPYKWEVSLSAGAANNFRYYEDQTEQGIAYGDWLAPLETHKVGANAKLSLSCFLWKYLAVRIGAGYADRGRKAFMIQETDYFYAYDPWYPVRYEERYISKSYANGNPATYRMPVHYMDLQTGIQLSIPVQKITFEAGFDGVYSRIVAIPAKLPVIGNQHIGGYIYSNSIQPGIPLKSRKTAYEVSLGASIQVSPKWRFGLTAFHYKAIRDHTSQYEVFTNNEPWEPRPYYFRATDLPYGFGSALTVVYAFGENNRGSK